MRHRVRIRKLGRTSKHFEATRRNLVVSLFKHGRVKTTLAKAKAFRPFAEKMVTLARKNQALTGDAPEVVARRIHNIRTAVRHLQDKSVVKMLFEEISPRYVDRAGGYTRIIKLSKPRLGDCAPTAFLELVQEGSARSDRLPQSSRRRRVKKRRAPEGAQAAAAPTESVAMAEAEEPETTAPDPVETAGAEPEVEQAAADESDSADDIFEGSIFDEVDPEDGESRE